MKREMLLLLTSACALTLALLVVNGCGQMGGNEFDPPAAEIVEVTVEPDPVVVGDTATFTCVVERNAPSLRFGWFFPGGFDGSDTNRYRWVASVPPGDYQIVVTVDSPGEPFEQVQSNASFTVVARD